MCSFRIACSSKAVKSSNLFKQTSAPVSFMEIATLNTTENYAYCSQSWNIKIGNYYGWD